MSTLETFALTFLGGAVLVLGNQLARLLWPQMVYLATWGYLFLLSCSVVGGTLRGWRPPHWALITASIGGLLAWI